MENLNINIGTRISHLRKSHGITQEKLAECLDVSVKHISSVERGLSSLSLEKFILISDILDCSLDYLILGKSSSDITDYIPASVLNVLYSDNEEEIALLHEYLAIYAKLRKKN